MLPPHVTFPRYHGKSVHLGVCGSVAAIKAAELVRDMTGLGIRVTVTLTEAAARFVSPLSFSALGAAKVYEPMFSAKASPFDHLDPGAQGGADAMLIAPASASMLGKIACGIADDLLSCQAMSFPGPLLLAPAMNPRMWASAAVSANWSTLLKRGATGIGPVCGPVACGETGTGRLAEPWQIAAFALRALSPKDMAGKRVLVNLGPTREYFDVARFWSNPSSGLMGAAMAMAAWLRGAEVFVVSGPAEFEFPDGVTVTKVTSAAQMHEACLSLWPACDACAATAAVSDFAPVSFGPGKFKRDPSGASAPEIVFTPTRDILADMGAVKAGHQVLIGFAAETGDLVSAAKEKLARKRCDIVAANLIGSSESGFATQNNRLTVADRRGGEHVWPVLSKTENAWKLWDLALGL